MCSLILSYFICAGALIQKLCNQAVVSIFRYRVMIFRKCCQRWRKKYKDRTGMEKSCRRETTTAVCLTCNEFNGKRKTWTRLRIASIFMPVSIVLLRLKVRQKVRVVEGWKKQFMVFLLYDVFWHTELRLKLNSFERTEHNKKTFSVGTFLCVIVCVEF